MKRTSVEMEAVLESLEDTNEDLTYLLGQLRTSLLLEKLCPGVFQHGKCRTKFDEDDGDPRFFIYRGDGSPPEIFPMEEVPEEFLLVEAEKRGITATPRRPGDGNIGMNGPVGKWIHAWMLSREKSKRRTIRR